MKQQHSIKNTAALVLALGALAEPALAVTSIDTCREITQPGSYRLTKNLVAPNRATGLCIVIKASHVTLDLAGHRIQGFGQGGRAVEAATAGLEGITVRNGAITGFSTGVLLGQKSVIERLNIFDTEQAIIIDDGRVEGNTIVSGHFAIQTGGRAIVTGNTIREATFAGITSDTFDPMMVTDNLLLDNSALGIGRLGGDGSLIAGNTVRGSATPILVDCPGILLSGNVVSGGGPIKELANPGTCVQVNNVQ